MKKITLVHVLAALISASAVAAENGSDVSIQGVKVEHHDIKDKDGTVFLTADAFYRGTNSILETAQSACYSIVQQQSSTFASCVRRAQLFSCL